METECLRMSEMTFYRRFERLDLYFIMATKVKKKRGIEEVFAKLKDMCQSTFVVLVKNDLWL